MIRREEESLEGEQEQPPLCPPLSIRIILILRILEGAFKIRPAVGFFLVLFHGFSGIFLFVSDDFPLCILCFLYSFLPFQFDFCHFNFLSSVQFFICTFSIHSIHSFSSAAYTCSDL